MDVCAVCPGVGGGQAVGICSGCARLICTNHLVNRVGYDASLDPASALRFFDVWATFPHGQERFLLSEDVQDYDDPAAVGYVKAWASGISLCVACRYQAARAAARQIQEPLARRRAAMAQVRQEFRTAGDPQRLMDLIVSGVEASAEEWTRAWTVICPAFGPPTHTVVTLTAAGMFGTRRPIESASIPVWRIPGAILHPVYANSDDQVPDRWKIEDGYLDATGTVWCERGAAFIVKDSSRRVVLERGVAPQPAKNGYGVLSVVNGRAVQEAIATIDPIARVVADAVRHRRGLALTPHPASG